MMSSRLCVLADTTLLHFAPAGRQESPAPPRPATPCRTAPSHLDGRGAGLDVVIDDGRRRPAFARVGAERRGRELGQRGAHLAQGGLTAAPHLGRPTQPSAREVTRRHRQAREGTPARTKDKCLTDEAGRGCRRAGVLQGVCQQRKVRRHGDTHADMRVHGTRTNTAGA